MDKERHLKFLREMLPSEVIGHYLNWDISKLEALDAIGIEEDLFDELVYSQKRTGG